MIGAIPSVDAAVSNEEAMRYGCPACLREPGVMCVYTSPYAKDSAGNPIELGRPCQVAHWQRKNLVRAARWRYWNRKMHQDSRPVHPASRAQHQIHAAMLEFDVREYVALRDWLREHGHILWDPAA